MVQNEIGKGSFQELDQISAVTMYTKWRGAPNTVAAIPGSLQSALQVSNAPFLGCYQSLNNQEQRTCLLMAHNLSEAQ